jgi:hypothetical protein
LLAAIAEKHAAIKPMAFAKGALFRACGTHRNLAAACQSLSVPPNFARVPKVEWHHSRMLQCEVAHIAVMRCAQAKTMWRKVRCMPASVCRNEGIGSSHARRVFIDACGRSAAKNVCRAIVMHESMNVIRDALPREKHDVARRATRNVIRAG